MFPSASTDGKCAHFSYFHSTEEKKCWPFTITTKIKQASKPIPRPKHSPQGGQVWNVTISSLCSPQLTLTLQQRKQISGKFRRGERTAAPNWITRYLQNFTGKHHCLLASLFLVNRPVQNNQLASSCEKHRIQRNTNKRPSLVLFGSCVTCQVSPHAFQAGPSAKDAFRQDVWGLITWGCVTCYPKLDNAILCPQAWVSCLWSGKAVHF